MNPTHRTTLVRALASAAALAAAAWTASCAAASSRSAPPPEAVGEANVGLFERIDRALADDDVELARRLLDDVDLDAADAGSLAAVQRIEDLLTGREVVSGLELWLESRTLPDEPGRRELLLLARHAWPTEVRLDLPPGPLVLRRTGVDPLGVETQSGEQRASAVLGGFTVAPGELPTELTVDRYDVPMAGLLALRERWSLETRDGRVVVDGRAVPAADIDVRPVERTMLQAELAGTPLDAGPLLAFLSRDEVFGWEPARFLPAMMERTVRIPPSRAETAFAEVAALAGDWDDARLLQIDPALRWLARLEEQVPGPNGWRKLFELSREAPGN